MREDEVINELKSLSPTLLINTRDLMKPENEIKEMTERFMTKDVLFGYVTNLSLKDYFDAGKLEVARKQVAANDRVIVVGSGAAMIAQAEATLVYVDMARWEIQQRFRAHEVKAFGEWIIVKMLCLYNIREGILMIGEFLISIRKACLIKPISGWIRTLQTIRE